VVIRRIVLVWCFASCLNDIDKCLFKQKSAKQIVYCFTDSKSITTDLKLFRVAYSTGFTDNRDFYLTRISHFVLYFLGNIERQ